MYRTQQEKIYWDANALDPEVDTKYICDLPTPECLDALGELQEPVLEIGCGVGRLMKPGYYGVDISENMLEIAQKRNPDAYFFLTDGRSLQFEDNFFHSVYSVLLFQHLPLEGVEAYIKESARVLVVGGVLKFQFIHGTESEPFSHHHRIKDIVDILTKNNFVGESMVIGSVHPKWVWITARKYEQLPI